MNYKYDWSFVDKIIYQELTKSFPGDFSIDKWKTADFVFHYYGGDIRNKTINRIIDDFLFGGGIRNFRFYFYENFELFSDINSVFALEVKNLLERGKFVFIIDYYVFTGSLYYNLHKTVHNNRETWSKIINDASQLGVDTNSIEIKMFFSDQYDPFKDFKEALEEALEVFVNNNFDLPGNVKNKLTITKQNILNELQKHKLFVH